jgi:ADP-ribosylglycohydrolase
MKVDYLDKFSGTLLGVAVGDTLGHPFEGILREDIYSRFSNFDEFIKNNKKIFETYTDDTQLTLHTAEALVKSSGYNLKAFIKEYVNWLDDPPIGPGFGCISSIRKLRYGVPSEIAASSSGGNGTTMRVSPIGLYYCRDIDNLVKVSIESSQITHTHPAASAGAVVIARAIAYLIEKTPKSGFEINEFFQIIIGAISDSRENIWDELIDILNKVKKNLQIPIEAGLIKFSQAGVRTPYFIEEYLGRPFVHPYTLSTVACAIFIFLKNLSNFRNCIYSLATAGGDSDTVGAIGGSLAGAYFGLDNIPEDLKKIVKNDKYILRVSEKLYHKFEERYL